VSYDLILTVAIAALAFAALWLRTNIALGILSLTAGYTLSDLIIGDIVALLYKNQAAAPNVPAVSAVTILVIMLPSVLLMLRFKGYQPGRFLVHLAPAFVYGLLAVLFVVISLPVDTQAAMREQSFVYIQLDYFKVFIVLGAVIIAVFDLMAHERKLRRRAKRRKHRKTPE